NLNGSALHWIVRSTEISSRTKIFIRRCRPRQKVVKVFAKCSVTCGNGRAAPTLLIPVIAQRRERSVNTMGNSCAINTCCVVAPALHHEAISAAPIAISFNPKNAGSLQESDSHAIHNELVGRDRRARRSASNLAMSGDCLTAPQISAPESSDFLADVVAGLSSSPRTLPYKYF